jgi:plastocyanin domain-containing protein
MNETLYIFLGIVLAGVILVLLFFRKPQLPRAQRAEIHLEGEFRPSSLRVRSGLPLYLHIHRLESEPEEEWFLVKQLGIREPLPPLMTTIVHFEPLSAGEFKLECTRSGAEAALIAEPSEQ